MARIFSSDTSWPESRKSSIAKRGSVGEEAVLPRTPVLVVERRKHRPSRSAHRSESLAAAHALAAADLDLREMPEHRRSGRPVREHDEVAVARQPRVHGGRDAAREDDRAVRRRDDGRARRGRQVEAGEELLAPGPGRDARSEAGRRLHEVRRDRQPRGRSRGERRVRRLARDERSRPRSRPARYRTSPARRRSGSSGASTPVSGFRLLGQCAGETPYRNATRLTRSPASRARSRRSETRASRSARSSADGGRRLGDRRGLLGARGARGHRRHRDPERQRRAGGQARRARSPALSPRLRRTRLRTAPCREAGWNWNSMHEVTPTRAEDGDQAELPAVRRNPEAPRHERAREREADDPRVGGPALRSRRTASPGLERAREHGAPAASAVSTVPFGPRG